MEKNVRFIGSPTPSNLAVELAIGIWTVIGRLVTGIPISVKNQMHLENINYNEKGRGFRIEQEKKCPLFGRRLKKSSYRNREIGEGFNTNSDTVQFGELMRNKAILKVHTIPKCDICLSHGSENDALYEAKTTFGPWAFLCEKCFNEVGISLKLGLGRRVILIKEDEEKGGVDT